MLWLCVTEMQNFWSSYPYFDFCSAIVLQHTHHTYSNSSNTKSVSPLYTVIMCVVSVSFICSWKNLSIWPEVPSTSWLDSCVWCESEKTDTNYMTLWSNQNISTTAHRKQVLIFNFSTAVKAATVFTCVFILFTVQGGCIQGSPSICIGNAFLVLRGRNRGINRVYEIMKWLSIKIPQGKPAYIITVV